MNRPQARVATILALLAALALFVAHVLMTLPEMGS